MAAKIPVAFEITNDDHDKPREAQPSEIAELVLGPFSQIPKLEFADVEVGCEALQTVNLRNPTDAHQCVIVIHPKDFLERGLSFNADEFEIPPYSKAELQIRFKPVKEIQCRDTICVKDKFRNQKSQFQLASRAVIKKKTRKRKTWTMNFKPVVVPTNERNVKIESLPPKTPVIVAPGSSVEHIRSTSKNPTLNVTFPVVSVDASTSTEVGANYSVKPEPVSKSSAAFGDTLEDGGPGAQAHETSHARFTSRTDTFTFDDSLEMDNELNKENPASAAKKRCMYDISFSEIGFDDLTPDRTVTRGCLRSIENVAHNTSTPKLTPSMVKYYTSVTTIKQEFFSPQPDRGNYHGSKTRDTSNGAPTQPCKDPVPIKLEPVTPKPGSSWSPTIAFTTDSAQINVKNEPLNLHASLVDNQADSRCAFKIPPAVCFKEEVITPIPRSESMRNVAFSISPPKETQSSRRKNLFGGVSTCSTPCQKEPVFHTPQSSSRMYQAVKQEADSTLHQSWNANASNASTTRTKVSARPKETTRGTTLSPKSLVAFKKNVRVYVPPKNLSRPSSAKSDSSISSEPVVVDMHIHDFKEPVYNLDIYGATTVSDPFARCAIHPMEFMEKQGRQLIKWVNSILTPPEEYSAYEAGVDVASLWKKSISLDTVPLPPSRETVSSKFHKNERHLLNLRKTAHQIFKSASITETLYKIHAKIDKGYISVKDDIDLHCDQGARCHLVRILLYYNPLWLRIGLEAIYGKAIPLHPRHTVIGLMDFIKNHLLSDKYIVEKNSYQNIQRLKMPKFKKEMNDFIVFKFFSLVFFLDIAKQKAIVPYDPCLFNKDSPIKESEGMINEFIKEFIKCVARMNKNLASVGFIVSHKQTAVDEYDFAVHTHLDLRDGANLTRLMELILQKKQLIRKLRLPAISRLQKVHNVKLAYTALEEEGVSIVDVLPFDVVDGHREKIMSLLWQILHKFLKPRMEKSAVIIQKWWRKNSLKLEIARRIQSKKDKRLETAAVKIQSFWRGYILRKNFPNMKTDLEARKSQCRLLKENAAIAIQLWYRKTKQRYRVTAAMKEQKQEHATKCKAVVTIQQHYRAAVERRRQRSEYLLIKNSAVVIQRWYRARVAMKKQKQEYETKRTAVVTIQQHYRAVVEGRKQRNEYLLMKNSAVFIQHWYRATVAMKEQKQEYETKRKAVVTIQQHYRAVVKGRRQRNEYLLMKNSAVVIQRWFRATVAMKEQKQEYETKRKAVVTIQQHYRAAVRGRRQRNEYLLMKNSAVVIQRWFRATVAMKKQKQEYETKRKADLLMENSAVVIQRWYRATVAMKRQKREYETKRKAVVTIQQHYRAVVEARKQRNEYLLMKKSAVVIQRWYRATVAMKRQKREYETKRKAVVTIQQHCRAVVKGRKQRNEYLLMKNSAVVLQCWYRATVAMRRQKREYETKRKAVVTIQQHYRAVVEGRKERNEYLLMKNSAVAIQRWYLATVAMERQKREYETKRKAVVTIQRHYRAMVEARKQHNEYLLMKNSAVVIQRWYRATVAMKRQKREYETKRKAVVTIQQHYRAMVEARKQRNEYLLMKNSAIVIQRWYRATVAMERQKREYETKRKAVVTIQQHYRAVVKGRKQRNEYLLMKNSAVAIQCWYRATVAMKRQKREYETKRKAVVTIQQHCRAVVEGRKQRNEYLLMKNSAVVVQRWYRATVAMKRQTREYETKRKAVVTIQQHYRAVVEGRKQRNEYLLMKNSAVVIQCWYRATIAMKRQKREYETKRKAVVTIQQHYRAVVEGRKQRNEYLLMKNSAVVIQCWYRATVAMKRQKWEYETKRKAVVTIQQHYRAVVEGRKERNEYLLMKNSAVAIQRWYRATVAMKRQKREYETKHKAVVTIQQHYRAVVEGRKERNEYLLMKNSAVAIQRWYRATVAMKRQTREYETKRKAVVTIQQHYRAVVEGRKQRNEYLLMKNSAVVIQCWFLAAVAMKRQKREAVVTIQKHCCDVVEGRKHRNDLLMKNSAVVIQRWYRATVTMKSQQREYETKRKAVVTIQQRYCDVAEGRKQRNEYLLMKNSAVVIQRWYRTTVALKRQKREYETKRKAVVTIQQHYRAVVEGRKQRNEYLLMKNSAVIIQRWYRARVAMQNQNLEYELAEACERPIARRQSTLLQNYDWAIDFILSPVVKTKLNRTYSAFQKLDLATQYSPILCEKLAEPNSTKVFAVIYFFLDIVSRSEAYKIIFGHGLNVILNLTTYRKTYNAVWENTMKYDGINAILHLQGKFLFKKEDLFCRAATIIWLLSRSPEQIEEIKSKTEFVERMTYYSKKVLSADKNVPGMKRKPALPNLESDWGYSPRGRKGYREFPTRIDAISALLDIYDITL